jgi:ActR/RegA family two-component response regulator
MTSKSTECPSAIKKHKSSYQPVPSEVRGIMETILIVEDDPQVQRILTRLFQSDGYRVEVCGDGRSAMDAFRRGVPTAVILLGSSSTLGEARLP